jgi:xanthine dehydrogenase YagT iron-sulfur-binding subunit
MPRNRDKDNGEQGVTRRGFITSVGASTVVAATVGAGSAETTAAEPTSKDEVVRVTLHVNRRKHRLLVETRAILASVLRDRLGLTGTKTGCERGECGTCTVLIDGEPRYSCMTLAVEAEGKEITTIEGLMKGEELGPVQQAFADEDAMQCGYCTSGQIMTAEGFLRSNTSPSLDQIRHAMSGNLCRCGAYQHIFNAVERAATSKPTGGGGA